jgi:glycine hydroxymethyltransferase
MKIAIGCDHGGFPAKAAVIEVLRRHGAEVEDLGCHDTNSVDYPDYARAVCERIVEGRADRGVLICTTGTGMAVAANRFSGIRAAVCDTPERARRGRSHNDVNVLVLAGACHPAGELAAITTAWLEGGFEGAEPGKERHARRIEQIERAGRRSEFALLGRTDPEIHAAIAAHIAQEDSTINLIASENYVSRSVREAQGSVLTNKYAEGYPGKRWYSGCLPVDAVERLAIERACTLFGAEHANVQPHCGSAANMAVYFALLQPGDTILAMSLDQGGHLTHGSPVNFSGRLFKIEAYKVSPETEQLDYDALEAQAIACKPKLIVAGASAYARTLDFPRFRAIADKAGALLMVDMAHIAGLVAGGAHPSPVPYADVVTSTTHKTLRGPRSGLILCRQAYAKEIDKTVFPGMQGGPQQHTTAAKAVCFKEALDPSFRAYAAQIVKNAKTLAATLAEGGFRIVSGGTDNHLMLVDVAAAGLTGKDAAAALDAAGIIVNKNTIPFDSKSAFVTSGIRIGTAAVTTRGMGEAEMRKIGGWIVEILKAIGDTALQARVREEVTALTSRFLVP